jgi:hypothetical protein
MINKRFWEMISNKPTQIYNMQRKHNVMASLAGIGICAILALGTEVVRAEDQKVDPNGTWKWTQPGRNGNPGAELTLKLKADGDKVTGTLTSPGRGGGDPVDTEISDAKLTGNQISFNVVRDFNGNSMTNKYEGKIEGDTITGTQTRGRRGGGGGGNGGGANGGDAGTNAPANGGGGGGRGPQPREWIATRSK